MKYWITQHCKERYLQRVNNGLAVSNDNITIEILKTIGSGKDITDSIYDKVPRYILFLHERYKECGQRVIKSGNIIFITKKREGTFNLSDVFTCFIDNDFLEKYRNSALSREEIFMKIKAIKKKNKAA